MKTFPLRSQRARQALGHVSWDDGAGEDELDLIVALGLLRATACGERRHRLQAPFLVGDPAEGVVSVVDDLALPPRLLLLPLGPCARGEVDSPVDVAAVALCGRVVESMCVEQGAPRGYRQKV